MMHRTINRAVAAGVFLVTMLVYLRTLAPTVVFWDVGEFIAAAKLLQVPHPPGSPLFLLFARIALMIPFAGDQAVRAHTLSALLSALAVAFFYLVIVRAILHYRRSPESPAERLAVYGGAACGALSLAFSTTYWDNAIEAEVYGASMLFVSVILWLGMRWMERADSEGNEKYLLLIAYLIGLSLGVHLLSLLAIFPVLLIVYFRKYEVRWRTIALFAIVTTAVFFVVYPGIVKYLPGMMDGDFAGQKGPFIAALPWIIIGALCYAAVVSYRKRQNLLHVATMSMLLVILGYTTYTSVLIRSNANPPMNENAPDNLSRLTAYLGREQYGDQPLLLPRRWSQEAHQQRMYKDYTSDWDFLVRYQLNHMFFRYVGWNFVGSAAEGEGAGVDWKQSLAIPILLALLGLFQQGRKDWKMALVFVSMFIIMGPVLALYQNQQEPQPRERDYFYVGAYYVLSLWIGLGVVALLDSARTFLRSEKLRALGAGAGVVAVLAAVPGNLLRINWQEHDRSGNYVAWDHSYNMLQTCDKDAILFTYADNDTFPLWYLQDVEGIRRDVSIVNLSLANMPWYVQQMKKTPYYSEALPVPLTLSDASIEELQPVRWEPRIVDLPVSPEALAHFKSTDTSAVASGKIRFLMRNTLQFGRIRAIRVQDIVARDIIFANQWKRPVYFAATCTPDCRIGLDDFLWYQGLAWQLRPSNTRGGAQGVDADALEANLFNDAADFSRTPRRGYRFRNFGDPAAHFDESSTNAVSSYRSGFLALSSYQMNVAHDSLKSVATLDRMESILPRSKFPVNLATLAYIGSMYLQAGRADRFKELGSEIEPAARAEINAGTAFRNPRVNPYMVLLDLYNVRKEFGKSAALLDSLQGMSAGNPQIQQFVNQARQMIREQQDSTRPPK